MEDQPVQNKGSYARTTSYVRSIGIDPNTVGIDDGLNTKGYNEIQYDEEGRRLWEDDENGNRSMVTVRREWPSAADALRVIELFLEEGGAEEL